MITFILQYTTCIVRLNIMNKTKVTKLKKTIQIESFKLILFHFEQYQ